MTLVALLVACVGVAAMAIVEVATSRVPAARATVCRMLVGVPFLAALLLLTWNHEVPLWPLSVFILGSSVVQSRWVRAWLTEGEGHPSPNGA